MDKRQFTFLFVALLLVAGSIVYSTISANQRNQDNIHAAGIRAILR